MILEQNSELGRPILSPHTAQVRLLPDRREGKKNPTGCREDQNEHWREEKCFTERKILSAYQKKMEW